MRHRKTKLRGPVKWHGGKCYLARRFIKLFPQTNPAGFDYTRFIDLTLGGGTVPLNIAPSPGLNIIVNDLDRNLMRMWMEIRNEPHRMANTLNTIEYCERNFSIYRDGVGDDFPLSNAVGTIVRSRFSRGGLGQSFAESNRLRGGQMGDKNAWETMLRDEFPVIAEVVQNWTMLNEDLFNLIPEYSSPQTLFYCDPPYVHSTRNQTTTDVYHSEWDDAKHALFLGTVRKYHERDGAKFFISSYPSPLYESALREWQQHTFSIANHSSQLATKPRKVEVLWESPDR